MRGEVKEVYKFLTMTLISLLTDYHMNYDVQEKFLNENLSETSLIVIVQQQIATIANHNDRLLMKN